MSKKVLPTPSHNLYQDERQHVPAHHPSLGWFDFAKPARLTRKQKRGWKRKASGHIVAELVGLFALALVATVLLVGVL